MHMLVYNKHLLNRSDCLSSLWVAQNIFKSWRHQPYTTALHIGTDTLYELAEFLNQFIVKHMNLDITYPASSQDR
jgi:hypothetical protein